MAFLQIQTQKFSLAGSGAALGATSIVLKSLTDIDGNTIAMTDLGTVGYMTLEPGNGAQEEAISFSGITQNSNGTATLTGVKTQLFKSPYTETSGTVKTHAGSTTAILTNSAGYYEEFAHIENDETIEGTWTFTPIPLTTGGDPTADNELARKAYVDATATGTTNIDRIVIAGIAGETITIGQIVQFDLTAKEWLLADASVTGTAENRLLGIAQGAGTNGNAITGGVLIQGLDTNQTGMTAGTKQFLSDTSGGISESAGTINVSLGFSNTGSTTDLLFVPGFDLELTEDQRAAIAGSSGTPSSTNTFITEDDVSDAAVSGKVVRATGTALPALDGSNLTSINANRKLTSFTSDVNIPITNVTETDLITFTVPAGDLGTANIIKAILDFSFVTASSTQIVTFRLKYGSTTIASITLRQTDTSSRTYEGILEGVLFANGTGAQEGYLKYAVDNIDKDSAGTPEAVAVDRGTATEDSTGALILKITAQHSGTGIGPTDAFHGYMTIIQ